MSWNNGGGPPSPWGPPGGRPPPRPDRGPDNNGPDRGENRGPWGKGGRGTGGGGGLPDLDELIARMQDKARRFVPGGGGPGGGGGGGGFGFGRGQGRLIALIGIVALAAWVGSGFYRVQPDEQGVVLRFGAFDGRTTGPGLNYHLPWPFESVITPSVTTLNSVEIGFRGPAGDRSVRSSQDLAAREVPEEALMLTGDENIIDINFSVFWRIRNVGDYLFNIRAPGDTVRAAAESTMRQVIGRTPIQPALAEARARIEADVTAGTQAILDQYHAGVEVTQVQLQRVDPPAAVIDSFRDVQRATTEAEQLRNEAESYRNGIIPRARGDAARLTAEAEGARLASIAEAKGQAQRFLSVYSAYAQAKDVTLRRLYIETMQEILQHTPVTVVDDQLKGVVPFLQIEPGKAPANAPPGTGTSASSATGVSQ